MDNLTVNVGGKDGVMLCRIDGRPDDMNAWAAAVHQLNAKWWRDPATGHAIQRNKGQMRMLMISEVSEAMEGERKGLMDDKLPHRPMAEVELADVVIRALDYAGGWNYSLRHLWIHRLGIDGKPPEAMPRHFNDDWRKFHKDSDKGEILEQLCVTIIRVGQPAMINDPGSYLSVLLFNCEYYCRLFGYDLWGAVIEKLQFNCTRADHQAEARLRADGKKW